MRNAQPTSSYSSDVDIWMDCGPHGRIPLSHASSTFVIAAQPATVPACEAMIVLTVDGKRYERPVRLINGMSPGSREAMVLAHDDAALPF